MKTPQEAPQKVAKIHTLRNGATLRITEREWASGRLGEDRAEMTPREAVLAILLDKLTKNMEEKD